MDGKAKLQVKQLLLGEGSDLRTKNLMERIAEKLREGKICCEDIVKERDEGLQKFGVGRAIKETEEDKRNMHHSNAKTR